MGEEVTEAAAVEAVPWRDYAVDALRAWQRMRCGVRTDGTRIGRYRIGRLLGAGGMGVVFEGVDEQLDRRVAIKVFRAGFAGRRQVRAMLRGEARALAQLRDPRIVEVFDFGLLPSAASTGLPEGCVDTTAFIVMEVVHGRPLSELNFASWRALRPIVLEVIDALSRVHESGATHGDIKPSNIIVAQDGRVKIVDFGLARLTGGREQVGAGTPRYMAPELFYDSPISASSDQYALCVALFELIHGRRPHQQRSLPELLAAKTKGEVDWAGGRFRIPAGVRSAISRGLDPDPAKRFVSLRALGEALRGRGRRRYGRVLAGAISLALVGLGLAAARPSSAASAPASVASPARAAVFERLAHASGTDPCPVDIERVETAFHVAHADGLTLAAAALAGEAGRLAMECADDRGASPTLDPAGADLPAARPDR